MSGDESAAPGPAANLLQSATRLGGTLLAVVQTRVELLTTEISEDVERGVRFLLWGLVAVLAAVLGLLLAGITLIIYYWDTHRMAAAVGVTAAFVVLSAVAAWVARARLHEKPKLLDATRTELRRDVDALRGDR
ncbi:MAG: phage holin family protein [Steroidobacteraceae bacterium]|nr:phage holin family protein [Steroidobacteraceae bacterium]